MNVALKQIHELKGHDGFVSCISCSEDGKFLVSGSRDKNLIIWELNNLQNPKKKRVLKGHSNFVSGCIFSKDSSFLISSSWDGTLRKWDTDSGEEKVRFHGHKCRIFCVDLDGNDKSIISGDENGNVKLWNCNGDCLCNLKRHSDWVSCIKFPPIIPKDHASYGKDFKVNFFSGSYDKTVNSWEKRKVNHVYKKSELPITSLAVSPDCSLLVFSGKDGKSNLFDISRRLELLQLVTDKPISSCCFSPKRYWLCVGTANSIIIWDLEKKNVVANLKPKGKKEIACLCLCWSNDGEKLYAGYSDNMIRIWGFNK